MQPTEIILQSCSDVLESMYFTSVFDTATTEVAPLRAAEDHTYVLHFEGDFQGEFGVHTAADVATRLASSFLGEDEQDLLPSQIGEVIGELANILCGACVSRLGGHRRFVLSHPQPLPISSPMPSQPGDLLQFTTDSGDLFVWFATAQPGSQQEGA